MPDVGEVGIKWSSAKYIGNYLYLASSCVNESDIHRYHMIKKSWQKLPRLSFPEIIQCLCSIGDYVYAISQSSPSEIYTLADNTRQQCRNNLRLFAQEGLDTVAAAVMICMGSQRVKHRAKPALVHFFDPTKNKWEKISSTCYPHFGSSLIVVNNRLYAGGGGGGKRGFIEVCPTGKMHR